MDADIWEAELLFELSWTWSSYLHVAIWCHFTCSSVSLIYRVDKYGKRYMQILHYSAALSGVLSCYFRTPLVTRLTTLTALTRSLLTVTWPWMPNSMQRSKLRCLRLWWLDNPCCKSKLVNTRICVYCIYVCSIFRHYNFLFKLEWSIKNFFLFIPRSSRWIINCM